MQKQISDTAGLPDGLAKIIISNVSGSLGSFDADIKALSRAVKSAMNEFAYFQTKLKSVNTETGKASIEMFVQRSELQNALNAINYRRGRWGDTHEAQYDINSSDVRYATGYMTLHGKRAQARAMAEVSGIAGGQLLSAPSKSNADRYKFLLPLPDDISSADSSWLRERKNAVFSGSLKMSREEGQKRKLELEEKETQRQINEVKKQKLEVDRARAKNAKELQKLEEAERREKESTEKEVANMLAYWDEKDRKEREQTLAEKEKEVKRQEAGEQKYHDIFRKAELKQLEDDKKAKEKEEAKAEREAQRKLREEQRNETRERLRQEHIKREEARQLRRMLGMAVAGITVIADVTRRILSSVIGFATQRFGEAVSANTLGVSAIDAINYGYFDISKGLTKGTTMGGFKDFQEAFGDITALDEKKLEILARVLGADVEKMVRSGIGGENPEKLMELTFDKFFKQYLEGKNSLGMQVGQEQARRELVTVLNKISPNLAKLFSVATYQRENGADFSTWKEFFGGAPKGAVMWWDVQTVNALGETVNGIKAQLEIFKDSVLTELSKSLSGFADKVANLRLGDDELTRRDKDVENQRKNREAEKQFASLELTSTKLLRNKLKSEYNYDLPDDFSFDEKKNLLGIQRLALMMKSRGDMEGLALLTTIQGAMARKALAIKEGSKTVGEGINWEPMYMGEEYVLSEAIDRAKEYWNAENTIAPELDETTRQALRSGKYDSEEVRGAFRETFGQDEKSFFTRDEKGKLVWGEQTKSKHGKALIKTLKSQLGIKKDDELLNYLAEGGTNPKTLLGGTNEANILKASGEFWGSSDGYKLWSLAQGARFGLESSDIADTVKALVSASMEGMLESVLKGGDIKLTADYSGQVLNLTVNNTVDGKTTTQTETMSIPGRKGQRTSRTFTTREDFYNGRVTNTEMSVAR